MPEDRRCETCKHMGSDPDGAFCSHSEAMSKSQNFGLSIAAAMAEVNSVCWPNLKLWEKDPANRMERFAAIKL